MRRRAKLARKEKQGWKPRIRRHSKCRDVLFHRKCKRWSKWPTRLSMRLRRALQTGAYPDSVRTPSVDLTSAYSAIELFYCARDLFDLIRCVRPISQLDPAIASQSTALLFHNDCLYVCHHLLTIGYQYKNQLPPPLNETATFVDMIPLFRKLGESALRSELVRWE